MTLTATVSTTSAIDPTSGNDSLSGSVAVNAAADVQVVKTPPAAIIAGGNATYTISVTNNGPSDAQNVVLNDPTPPFLTFVSMTSTPPVGCVNVAPCNIGTLTAGSSITFAVTYSTASNASGTVANTATVSTTTNDPTPGNNSSTATVVITQNADISVTKSGPASANPGSNVTFTIAVRNNGPSDAASVSLDDPTPSRLSLVSVTGACSGFPCSLGNMTAGQTATVQATYTVAAGTTTAITNTATATTATTDPNSANNSGSATLSTGCPSSAPTIAAPADGSTNVPLSGTLTWTDVGAASYTVYLDVQGPNACSKFFASTAGTSLPYAGLQPGTTYQWRVEAVSAACAPKTTACITFTTTATCPTAPPVLSSPVSGTVNNTATYSWSAVPGAKDYQLFVNGGLVVTTTATTFGPVPVPNGPVDWYVVAELAAPCGSLTSQTATFNGCDPSVTTTPSIVGQADSGQGYDLFWDSVAGATKYEADEADNPSFTNATTQSTTGTTLHFQHPATTPTAFYYRVRVFIPCANAFGPNSVVVRIVLSPVTSPSNPNVSVPAGNTTLVPIVVHIAGIPGGAFPFTASLDPQQPWLKSVTPSSGTLPPEGIDLTVLADPTALTDGTHTGTVHVIVTTPSSGSIVANGVTAVGAPVSISLVTPVTPKPGGTPPANSLVIPSTGHLDGVNSRWASDIRILNTASVSAHYQLIFTPDDTTQPVKQTEVEVDPGTTTALDDVVKTWYGVGSLGESSNGSLEIRPLDNPSKGAPDDTTPSVSFTTVATSRTYNAASSSTTASYGEFIPAIPFANFVGKALDSSHAATILGLQQIAQNDAMRTNLGLMEASGQPAQVLISVFDASGKKLLDTPMSLAGGQHVQLNGFLTQNHIVLPDGRIQVQVTGGDGKISAYAAVIDNTSGDPMFIPGVPLGQNAFADFVLPGVADLNTGLAAWRTDMRIFNPTATPQFTTMTFYPSSGDPQSTSFTVNAGEVKQLNNTLSSVFGVTNTGGAIHVTTTSPVPLEVSGRTYDLTSNGTFGQLQTAVTSADAIGQGDGPLQILQAEDSVRERTNLGLVEVTGKPATVEVSLFLPDSKVAPSTQIPLPANGFVQIPVIQSFGLSNVYNARISLKVVGGDGRISGYASVIDQITQAPTYVPAQK
ncbi:MAG TPA: DUF11 domain-containing protein [Vicinamibacterales bacterium]|nr:DUF11 domain-containing protein [Vicinamibacterales bacterium]